MGDELMKDSVLVRNTRLTFLYYWDGRGECRLAFLLQSKL